MPQRGYRKTLDGKLAGVLRKNGTIYYVWRRGTYGGTFTTMTAPIGDPAWHGLIAAS
jgi:hypothetical protein